LDSLPSGYPICDAYDKLGLEEGKTEEDQTDSGEASKDDSFCDDGFRLRIEEMGQSMMRQKDSGYCGSETNN